MAQEPALFGFAAEFLGDHPAYGELEEYLRTDFAATHPAGHQDSVGHRGSTTTLDSTTTST
jgi:hypothetical protein